VARRIRDDAVDVLVDLSVYQTGARPEVLAMRPAPVQVAYMGFPGTSGATFVDYLIADRTLVPSGEEARFTERVVRLPDTFWCYGCPPLEQLVPPARQDLGLPEDRVVLCGFHNGYKIVPELLDLWAELLQRVPDSVLWLLARNETAKRNLLGEATRRGVSPARIIFAPPLPHAAHLARQAAADLFLDTHQCCAATTAMDALWAGVPVVAFPGASFGGRQSASALAALSMPELIAGSAAEYLEIAVKLAGDGRQREAARRALARARIEAPLFDLRARVAEFEAAYAAMASRSARGLPPAAMYLVREGPTLSVRITG